MTSYYTCEHTHSDSNNLNKNHILVLELPEMGVFGIIIRSNTVMNTDRYCGQNGVADRGQESTLGSPGTTGQREVTTGDGTTREQSTVPLQMAKEYKREQAW